MGNCIGHIAALLDALNLERFDPLDVPQDLTYSIRQRSHQVHERFWHTSDIRPKRLIEHPQPLQHLNAVLH